MSFKDRLRKLIERATGIRLYLSQPAGVACFYDIARSLPHVRIGVIFDVGANLGQSAKAYANRFPNAHIHSFEPVGSTFQELRKNLQGLPRVSCHRLALGASASTGTMILQGSSDLFFLQDQSKAGAAADGVPTEPVEVTTLDEFCQSRNISHIDFLKVDTEGGDLDVLKGADRMLARQNVDLVQVEAGMNPGNTRHVPFESLKAYLEAHRYFVFRLYEQVNEWPSHEPQLRRVNAVFISSEVIARNRMPAQSRA